MKYKTVKIGSLDCTIADTPGSEGAPRALFVVCHGYGAPGTDLVPLAEEIFQTDPQGVNGVRFVFPMAPILIDEFGDFDGRAWWPIDIVKLQIMMQTGEIRDLRRDRPSLLDQRFEELSKLIEALSGETGVGKDRIVIGGFSQGAMLATETALRLELPLAGLVIWSGSLISESSWREAAGRRAGMPVVQTHGTGDPILPFIAAKWLHEMLVEAGLEARFSPFAGPHTISIDGIRMAAELLAKVPAK